MNKSSKQVRLQKFIADCGITSRRKAEDLIVQGRVKVNGKVTSTLGTKIDPSIDVIFVDDQAIDQKSVSKIYIVMNKPKGYVTTSHDPEGRPTVMDLCKEVSERIYPVGRLDYHSEGLLILTNDGDVANQIIHPSSAIEKVYEVKVFGAVTEALVKKLRSKVTIDGTSIRPASVRLIERLKNKTWLEFRLNEGKNREIRKICAHNGVTIDKLKRVAIGGLGIDGLAVGKYGYITKRQLLETIGIAENSDEVVNYVSVKKSVKIKDSKIHPKSKLADDKRFYKFRKEFYYDTLNNFKDVKKEEQIRKNGVVVKEEISESQLS